MHQSSYDTMWGLLRKLAIEPGGTVLDVGSRSKEGEATYRELVERLQLTYTGLDMKEGPNVDVVSSLEDYVGQRKKAPYDFVLCGQMLEHHPKPWEAVDHMSQLLKIGGYLILIAPWFHAPHFHPLDCFRILPQGMESLLEIKGRLDQVHVGTHFYDTWGIARRCGE